MIRSSISPNPPNASLSAKPIVRKSRSRRGRAASRRRLRGSITPPRYLLTSRSFFPPNLLPRSPVVQGGEVSTFGVYALRDFAHPTPTMPPSAKSYTAWFLGHREMKLLVGNITIWLSSIRNKAHRNRDLQSSTDATRILLLLHFPPWLEMHSSVLPLAFEVGSRELSIARRTLIMRLG